MSVDVSDVLVVVAARAGSKRLPNKNRAYAGGRSLLWWAMDRVERAFGGMPDVVVGSDDPAFLNLALVAHSSTPRVVILPSRLTQDGEPVEPAVSHIVTTLEERLGRRWKYIVQVEANVPVAPAWVVYEALETLLARPTFAAAIAVEKTPVPHWAGTLNGNAELHLPAAFWRNSDTHNPKYVPSGAAYVYRRGVFVPEFDRGVLERDGIIGIPHAAGQVVHVDTAQDLALADVILRRPEIRGIEHAQREAGEAASH